MVLVRIYRNCAILEAWLHSEAWLPFMTFEYVSSKHYCQAEVFCSGYIYANCGAIAVIASTTCHEYSPPFSPEMMMMVIDRDINIYIDNGNRSTKACC